MCACATVRRIADCFVSNSAAFCYATRRAFELALIAARNKLCTFDVGRRIRYKLASTEEWDLLSTPHTYLLML
jgi:hypothetical protein